MTDGTVWSEGLGKPDGCSGLDRTSGRTVQGTLMDPCRVAAGKWAEMESKQASRGRGRTGQTDADGRWQMADGRRQTDRRGQTGRVAVEWSAGQRGRLTIGRRRSVTAEVHGTATVDATAASFGVGPKVLDEEGWKYYVGVAAGGGRGRVNCCCTRARSAG